MSFNQIARFTSDASHELKTPLSLIRAEVEHALNSGAVSPDQEKTLISLLEQSARLSQIIDALLFLSRADNHRLELERCEVNLTEIVGDLIEDVEILASPFGITIRKELASDLLVLGDPSLLRRLLMNLFDNAIKYNRTGGMVIATSEQRGEEVALSIRNTGQGVKHGTENQIFERFFRGDPAHTKAIGGHGLGLSIAREIARAHGGELRLIASDTQWTEFRFSLPAKSRSLRTLNPASGVPEIAKL